MWRFFTKYLSLRNKCWISHNARWRLGGGEVCQMLKNDRAPQKKNNSTQFHAAGVRCSVAAFVHPWLKLYFVLVLPSQAEGIFLDVPKQALPVLFLHGVFLCFSILVWADGFRSWMLVTFILVSMFFAFETVLVCLCLNQQRSRKDICQTLSLWVSRGEVWRGLAESG